METKTVKVANYQTLELIHQSERTLVYRGINLESKQSVVVKLMGNEYPSFNELVQFRNQYAIAKNLDTPGIVKPYSLLRYKNGYALIMEDIGAISLAEYQHQFSISLKQFWEIALSITEILHHLHQNQIIHKDIKPANILIHPETKQVKLIDFSISSLLPKETQSLQTPNVLEGTLAYISPEQTGRMNRGIDYRSDFYSLGVTFYELLTGKLPFESEDPLELVHAHIAKSPPTIPETQVPIPLANIVLKLMAKNGEQRYQSALGLKYDLEKCRVEYQQTGKIDPFVLGERDLCDRFLIPEKLYGREKEVQSLLDGFERVAAGQTEMILVAGYSGIGKTAVVNEVHKPITRQKGYFIKGKFDQFNRNIPFSAFVIAFRDLMGQLLGESDAKLQKWKAKVLEAVGENGQVLIDVIPELQHIIGQQPPVPELSGNAAQNRFNLLFEKFIAVFTSIEHPLTLFIDDLQWADSASLNLLKVLMGENQTGYLLLLGAYRDNEIFPAHPLMLTLAELEKRCDSASARDASSATPRRRHSQAVRPSGNDSRKRCDPATTTFAPVSAPREGMLTKKGNAEQERERVPREQKATISTITLAPLSVGHINQLVAETLSCTVELAAPLTNLVDQKTKGNPFFTTQFLKGLYEDDLIVFNPNFGYWECDLVQVRDAAITDDVVEFMAGRLYKLPEATQNVLKLAACIGNQFDLETLAIIYETPSEEVATALWSTLQEGFILPQSEAYKFFQGWEKDEEKADSIAVGYRFLHDRVQQAAYSLIPEAEKASLHYHIGRLLLDNIALEEREEHIFELVGQLNYGIDAISKPEEKEELARLNLIACRKAKNATAYQAGREYADKGLSLLGENPWQEQYEMTLAFSELATEFVALCGEWEEMDCWVGEVVANSHSLVERANVYRIQIQANNSREQLAEAIEIGRGFLQQLGVRLSENPTEADITNAFTTVQELMENREVEDLLDLPEMKDEETIAIVQTANSIFSSTYTCNSLLFPLLVCLCVSLSIQYGNIPASSFAYVCYGLMISTSATPDIITGGKFGQLALQLVDKLATKTAKPEVLLMAGAFILHRTSHLQETLQFLQAGYTSGLETGNYEFAGHSGHSFCGYSLSCGYPLETLVEETRTYCRGLEQINQIFTANYTRIYWQAMLNLLAQAENPTVLSGEALQESEALLQWQAANDVTGLSYFHTWKLMLCYLFGDIESALIQIDTCRQYTLGTTGTIYVPALHFYAALSTLAGLQPALENVAEVIQQVEADLASLQHWADYAPMNHQHKVNLVEAEKCRVLGQKLEAIEFYDKAIAGAKENEFIQEEAIANELFAKFYLDWGREKEAAVYMQQAYYCYAQWGAKAKTDDLEKNYPQLLSPILQWQQLGRTAQSTINSLTKGTTSTVGTSTGELLDLASLMKASRSLSEEIDLDLTIANLMEVIQENAGAESVTLMLFQEEILMLTAQNTKEEMSLISIPVEKTNSVPLTIINHVKNTGAYLVLDNVKEDKDYDRDDYIQKHQPQSVLCIPLIDRGQLIGILYLENNQVSGAFTSDRIEILNLLCSQAAIALQNAQLYDKEQLARNELQQALTDLQQAQLQLVQSEKMAALGNLVAGVAHEINNPVGFIGGNVAPAQEHLQDLLSILSLYEENASLPESIAEQIEDLDADFIREDFPKLIVSMKEGCEVIRNISTSLRTFSRTDTVSKTEFNLHHGIDSTLLILKYRLKANEQRPAIEIVKNYGDIPEVKCYPGQLNQVFMNLLANGIDALDESNEGKTFAEIEKEPNSITIATELSEDNKQVIVRIADNGTGMPEEVKARLFQQGFTTKGVGKGTGLGMAIAYQIVTEKHGGMISCNSKVGQGTIFTIVIPR
ncbi:ATP-binding sensor histidine kinase [Okeania sp. SIO2C9]|uniref:trifunctional serine/threonine-protein kinase/ATP-binding protein/sensor histidine kinase n=1 Tax=Okeania sp. SIO2C9 TaxID=2607791 RepID=UPI0025D3F531|nr:ATP-binding sensor histidine kinase [Okeania sp. SIO2C9]